MGITIFKILIGGGGGKSSDIRSEITFFTEKLNFRPYIRRYTSPNEKFEYSYPLIVCFDSLRPSQQFFSHDTKRLNNVVSTSMRRNDVTST